MSTSSWKLPRRTFLRGGIACIGLPLLEQMVSQKAAHGAASSGPLRYIVMNGPCGIYMQRFTPTTTGSAFALPPILTPIEPIRSDILVVSGLQKSAVEGGGNRHLTGIATVLSCLRGAGSDNNTVNNNVTADQLIANALGGQTPFPSLQYGGGTGSVEKEMIPAIFGQTLSWKDPTTPLVKEMNPQAAFDRLFANGFPSSTPPTPMDTQAADALRASRKSVLDLVHADADSLRLKIGPNDQKKLDEYLTSLRELETRLATPATSSGGGSCQGGTRPASDFVSDYAGRINGLTDVLALAIQCDMSRVATFLLGDWESDYSFPELGLNVEHHGASHHGGLAENINALEVIDRWEVSRFVNLATKLKGMSELGGTVLDRTAMFFTSEVSDGDTHAYDNLPMLVAGRLGGAINPGRHVEFKGAPLANLWLSCLQAFGLPNTSFASSTGALNLLT